MVVAIILIITVEYRDAFGRLGASEERFRLCFQSARDPIFLLDPRTIADGNRATLAALGLASQEQLVGRTRRLSGEAPAGWGVLPREG